MFRVKADNVRGYMQFDPRRKSDLVKLDAVMRKSAPALKRYFHKGTPAGEAGMRMNLLGYGKFRYRIKSGKSTVWPVVGIALQKNYISVYVSVTKRGRPIVQSYADQLGELGIGRNNFHFQRFDDLNVEAVSALFAEVASIVESDPDNPVLYKTS